MRYFFEKFGRNRSCALQKMCRRHNILITPHQTTEGSAVWGSKGALWRCVSKTHYSSEASGSRAVTLWQPYIVAYFQYAVYGS